MYHIGMDLSYDRHWVNFVSIELLDGFIASRCQMFCVIMVIFVELIRNLMLIVSISTIDYLFDIFSIHLGRDTHISTCTSQYL